MRYEQVFVYIAGMADGLDLLEAGVAVLRDDEMVVGCDVRDELIRLEQLRRQLDAQISRRVAKLDATGVFALDHQRSAASWLTDRWRCSRSNAYRAVRRARTLRDLELTTGAYVEGAMSSDHVDLLVNLAYPDRHRSAFAEFEPTIVAIASSATFDSTELAARQWRHALDDALQRDTDSLAARQYESRGLSLVDGMHGMTFVHGAADPFDADIIRRALDHQYEALHQANDDRTPAQQRLDALVAVCRRYLGGISDAANREPHVVIAIPYDVFAGDTYGAGINQDGQPVSAHTARRAACAGTMQRLVHAATVPLDLGRSVRYFNRHQRRALAFRDGGCRFPGCDRPVSQTEAHHIIPFGPPSHGNTDFSNGLLLCWHHHHHVHELGWTIELQPNAVAIFTPPKRGAPLLSHPRRNPIEHPPRNNARCSTPREFLTDDLDHETEIVAVERMMCRQRE